MATWVLTAGGEMVLAAIFLWAAIGRCHDGHGGVLLSEVADARSRRSRR